MKLLNKTTNINFMGMSKVAMALSLLLVIASLGALLSRGLNLGIDFTGGTLIEVGYPKAVELSGVRDALSKADFKDAVAQHFGTARDVMVRIAPREGESSAELSSKVLAVLNAATPGVEMRRVEFVGPQVGDELREQGGMAMLFALIGILAYVALRFEYRFSLGSVLALIHDVVITIGVFAVTGIGFDLTVLAAILAVIGYSLNDTIVVFDRIRENFRKIRKGSAVEIVNISINQTLSRTLMTSFTTLLVLLALFYFGGEVIHSFAFALIIGIVVGTYSSIYVASSAALLLGISKQDLIQLSKKDGVVDDRP